MLFLVVILLVAFILTPLFDLVLKERPLYAAKLVVYVLAAAWVLYGLFLAKGTF